MDRPGPSVSSRVSGSIPLLAGGIFGGLSTIATVGDSDLFWHLAQGRQTLSEGLVRVDTFSWTVRGLPILIDQWLGQVVWYGAYATLGWSGIILLRALIVAAIATLIVAAALDAQRRPSGRCSRHGASRSGPRRAATSSRHRGSCWKRVCPT